jgi:Holliday junction resolvase RusA-like endonuclease
MIEIGLPWPPSGNHRNATRIRRGKIIVCRTQKTSDYFREVWIIARHQKIEIIRGDVELHLHFYKPNRKKYDEDNLKKVLYDAIVSARIIEDDSAIKSGAFSFDKEIVKGGLILMRIREHNDKGAFWAW